MQIQLEIRLNPIAASRHIDALATMESKFNRVNQASSEKIAMSLQNLRDSAKSAVIDMQVALSDSSPRKRMNDGIFLLYFISFSNHF